jgi:gas vesicle protein
MNINDSLLFLKIGRNTICEVYRNKELNYFIQNEASDYQVMNVIVHGIIPIEKYNLPKEKQLWEQFQDLIYENNNNLYKLIVEMGPISQYNLSSSKPFLTELGDQQGYAQDLYNNMKSAMSSARSTLQKGTKAAAEVATDTAKKASTNKLVIGMTAGAAATMIAFAAAKLYQQYLGKAAQACKGKPDKVACMKRFKEKALQMRIEKLRSGMSTCNKAKNSEGCQKSLQSKITKLQAKVDKK